MSIPASTVPAVVDWLVTNIAAHPTVAAAPTDGSQPVLVVYGPPGTYQPDDIIAVAFPVQGTFTALAMVGSGGAGWLREDYDVAVEISCFRGGDDAKSVFARAGQLAYAVADTVRSDPSIGDAVVQAMPAGFTWEQSWDPDHKGREVRVVVQISVTSQV